MKENMENLDLYIFQIKMSYVWVLRWIIMVIGYWIKNGNVRDKTETPETIKLCWSCWSYFIIFTIIYSLIGISSPTHSMKFCVSSSIIVHVLGLFLEPKGIPMFFREEFTKVLQWILMMIHIPTRWWLCRWQHLHHQCVTIVTVGGGVRDHKVVVASTLEKELSECIENTLGLFYEESLVEFGGLEFEGNNEQANFVRHY